MSLNLTIPHRGWAIRTKIHIERMNNRKINTIQTMLQIRHIDEQQKTSFKTTVNQKLHVEGEREREKDQRDRHAQIC